MLQFLPSVEEIIKRYPATVTFKRFLNSLNENQISYKAIDMKGVDASLPSAIIMKLKEQRGKNIVEAYLNAAQPTFGRMGLVHAEDVQNNILKDLKQADAAIYFCFFYLYSQPAAEFENHLEERVRKGEVIFPLGMEVVDATNTPISEVATLVIQRIADKQLELDK